MFAGVCALIAELRSVLLRVFAYVGAIALVCVFIAGTLRTAPVDAATELIPDKPEWESLDHSQQAFHVVPVDRRPEEMEYEIRRHPQGGRKDTLTFGHPGQRYLMIEIYRPGTELSRHGVPVAEIAARSENLGRIGKMNAGPDLESKFGPFAFVTFAARPEREINRCAGFVRVFHAPRVQIAGVVCNDGEALIDRTAIACTLDRLTLNAAGRDMAIAALFARAEIKRKFCGQRSPLQARTPKRPETTAPIKLRGRVAVR